MSLQEEGEGDLDIDTQREEGHVKTETEFGAVLPQARECQESWGAGRCKEQFPSPQSLWSDCGPADILIFGFLLFIKAQE